MSSEALSWAFKQQGLQSAVKFTLVALCECANYATGEIFPSVAHICEITSQNRKTVIANIAKLEAAGLVIDTGRRVGATKQIKVYQVSLGTVPKTEQSQMRNSSTFTRKESQKRDTEPSREPSSYIDRYARTNFDDLPGWVPMDAWAAWHDMRAGLGLKPLGGRALEFALAKLEELRLAGNDPRAVLDQSTFNEWKDIFEVNRPREGKGKNERSGKSKSAAGEGIGRALALTSGMGSSAADGEGRGNNPARALPNFMRT